jgi:hypothetical protein
MRQATIATVMLMVILLTLACEQKEAATPLDSAPYYKTLAEAQEAIGAADKQIVLDFFTDW